jgi:integrase
VFRFPYTSTIAYLGTPLVFYHNDATLSLVARIESYFQEALGHKSISTTEVYTHVAIDRKPASPIDTMEI